MALREVLGKHDVLVYLVSPGEQNVDPVESDGGDFLGFFENAVFLDQNVALGDQIQWRKRSFSAPPAQRAGAGSHQHAYA